MYPCFSVCSLFFMFVCLFVFVLLPNPQMTGNILAKKNLINFYYLKFTKA